MIEDSLGGRIENGDGISSKQIVEFSLIPSKTTLKTVFTNSWLMALTSLRHVRYSPIFMINPTTNETACCVRALCASEEQSMT